MDVGDEGRSNGMGGEGGSNGCGGDIKKGFVSVKIYIDYL